MADWIMVSRLVKIPVRNFAMVPTKCPNMFSSRVEAQPCPEFRNKFPNLYMDTDAIWQVWRQMAGCHTMYMIINFDYDRDIYISKDMAIAYAREEDAMYECLEVNEVIEVHRISELDSQAKTKHCWFWFGIFSRTGYRTPSCGNEGSTNFPEN